MIPKIIHYCWFGNNDMNVLNKRCIESWHKYCSDFEIKLWNEQNSDIDNEYCRQAIKLKKWAFVSDWVRFDVLLKYGGFYLDTDVELIKSLRPLVEMDCLLSAWEIDENHPPGAGFLAAQAGNSVLYSACKIIKESLIPSKKFVTSPNILRAALNINKQNDFFILGSKTFYPFNPFNHNDPMNTKQLMYSDINSSTYAIHHYKGSWIKNNSLQEKIKSKLFPNRDWSVRQINLKNL